MTLRKLVRSNYGGKPPVSIKYENVHSFKEGVILLCQSILETRRILHLPGSAHFTIPLSANPTKCSNTFKQFVGNNRRVVAVYLTILWGWCLKG